MAMVKEMVGGARAKISATVAVAAAAAAAGVIVARRAWSGSCCVAPYTNKICMELLEYKLRI